MSMRVDEEKRGKRARTFLIHNTKKSLSSFTVSLRRRPIRTDGRTLGSLIEQTFVPNLE